MTGKPISLIIDCDPGVDDAVALLLALSAPEKLDVLAITTVGGNVGADLTARNARIIRDIAGRPDVPVHAGAAKPLIRTPLAASHIHGESGLGRLEIFEPSGPTADGHSALTIVETVMRRPSGSVSLAITGPMTNVALAMQVEPRLANRLDRVVIMGGARSEGGNVTASAEYNIYADPHAAHIVLNTAKRITMLGLDATHQVRTTPARLAAIRALKTRKAKAAANLEEFSGEIEKKFVGGDAGPLHDLCTIAWLMAPDLFEDVPADISVELSSPITLGHTSVEFRVKGPVRTKPRWVTRVNADGVYKLLLEHLAR